nr:membrane protein insertion efficiency factor YidD [Parasutterella muris]
MFLLTLIRCYQLIFSPIVGHNCRFLPTCSHYSYTSIERFGAVKGCWLTLFRLLRCQPFGGSGIDEVPEKFRWRCWCKNSDCNSASSNYIFQSKLENTNHGK